MSYLEGDERKGPGTSQVLDSVQIVAQGPHRTQGPVLFELSTYNGSQSWNSHRGHTLRTFSCYWFLAMKSEEGNKATFSHWPRFDTLFATQAWISLRRLPEAKASKNAGLRVRCLRSVSFIGSKGACELIKNNRKFHLGRFLETGEQPMKVFIMCNMLACWA